MAKSKSKTQAVHVKGTLTPGSGAGLLDLIKLPIPVFIVIRLVLAIWRHLTTILFLTALLTIAINIYQGNIFALTWTIIIALGYITVIISYIGWQFDHGASLLHIFIAIYRRFFLKKMLSDFYAAAEIKKGFPRIRKLRYNPAGYRFKMKLSRTGKQSMDIAACSPEIASVFDAYEVKIDTPRPGWVEVHVSMGDPTQKVIRPGDIPDLIKKGMLAFAIDVNNKSPIPILLDLSLLIVGRSKSGKSNNFWEILNQLNRYNIPYRLRVIDPKGGVELAALEDGINTVAYCSNAKEANKIIEDADKAMNERLAWMRENNQRKIEIDDLSDEVPLDILVVDELLNLDKTEADTPYGRRLTQGRAALFITIAMSQLSQKDALGQTRDLYPQRICMGVDSPDVTNAALGDGAEKRGARASEIPATTPGIGYMFQDGKKGFAKLQSALIDDEETWRIANGEFVETTSSQQWTIPTFSSMGSKVRTFFEQEHAVYWYYNRVGRLLYVGFTNDPIRRIEEHVREKEWGHEIDRSLTEVVWYPTRKAAKKAETYAIHNDNPLYNKAESLTYVKEIA